MKQFIVTGLMTFPVYTMVQAYDQQEALAIAKERRCSTNAEEGFNATGDTPTLDMETVVVKKVAKR